MFLEDGQRGASLVGDVEELADLLRCLAFDHVGDGLAANIPGHESAGATTERFALQHSLNDAMV
jgi:hypothetical protein